jgi:DHA3 family tetracycline resistance protein-like MFS transporter
MAFILMASSTQFGAILIAQAVLGVGLTFVSGAQEAWITDEVGNERAPAIFLRSAQGVQVARLIGIPAGVGLGVLDLALPILLGGLLFIVLAGALAALMPEEGFRRRSDSSYMRESLWTTVIEGLRLVGRTPILPTLFAMAAFYEIAGEVFLRLSVAHFLEDTGLPRVGNFEPVVWFGAIRMASALAGLVLLQYVRRQGDSADDRTIGRQLLIINGLQFISLIAFALSTSFALGFVAYLSATSLSRVFQPLYLAMINLHVDSSVRATVISMSSQIDALGQSVGSPLLGLVGSAVSIRAALVGAALMLVPALGLNLRANSQHGRAEVVERPAT